MKCKLMLLLVHFAYTVKASYVTAWKNILSTSVVELAAKQRFRLYSVLKWYSQD